MSNNKRNELASQNCARGQQSEAQGKATRHHSLCSFHFKITMTHRLACTSTVKGVQINSAVMKMAAAFRFASTSRAACGHPDGSATSGALFVPLHLARSSRLAVNRNKR
jgi:hypothetical protein